jgi:hypothetical protein
LDQRDELLVLDRERGRLWIGGIVLGAGTVLPLGLRLMTGGCGLLRIVAGGGASRRSRCGW